MRHDRPRLVFALRIPLLDVAPRDRRTAQKGATSDTPILLVIPYTPQFLSKISPMWFVIRRSASLVRVRPGHFRHRSRHSSQLAWVRRPMASQAKIIDGTAIAKCVLRFVRMIGIINLPFIAASLFPPLSSVRSIFYSNVPPLTAFQIRSRSSERFAIASHRAFGNSELHIHPFIHIS